MIEVQPDDGLIIHGENGSKMVSTGRHVLDGLRRLEKVDQFVRDMNMM